MGDVIFTDYLKKLFPEKLESDWEESMRLRREYRLGGFSLLLECLDFVPVDKGDRVDLVCEGYRPLTGSCIVNRRCPFLSYFISGGINCSFKYDSNYEPGSLPPHLQNL
ncbi:MAG: hypothetical protein ABIH37_04495 [archaeon]